jgi:drug/metabolite transporter (DMT)-like permease
MVWLIPGVWSTNYLIARTAGPHVTPHVLAFGRWAIVAALLVWWCRHELRVKWPAAKAEVWQSVVLGAMGMWICGAWVYIGGQHTVAMNISLIYATAPIGIAAASQWLLGEKLGVRQVIAIGLALIGVVLVIVKGDWQALAAFEFNPGDPWIVACSLAWITYSLLLKRWPSAFSATARVACIATGGLVAMLPFLMWEVVTQPKPLSWQAGGLILAAAVFPGLIAYVAYSHIQAHLGAARASLMLYLTPVYVALLGWLLLGEPLRWYHFLGAALILPGIHLATRPAAKPASPPATSAAPAPQPSSQTRL